MLFLENISIGIEKYYLLKAFKKSTLFRWHSILAY